jgi:prepilin peptidase CpaA
MHELIIGLLLVWLMIAVYQDIRYYRIPNALVLSGALVGIVLNTLYLPEADTLGLLTSLSGLIVGLIVLLPLYLLRVMGAGDIKLMAMVGAFVGPAAMLSVTLYVLLAGGVLAIGLLLLRGRFVQVMDNLRLLLLLKMAKSPDWRLPVDATVTQFYHKLPYGVAIASGTIVYLLTA